MAETTTQENTTQDAKASKLKPEGVYKGTVIVHSLELSNKQTPFVELRVRLTHFENDELEFVALEEPFTRPVRLYLSEAAKDNSIQCLQWLGYQEKTTKRLNPANPDAVSFKGIEVFASNRHDEYKGKPKEAWNFQRRRKPSDQASVNAALEEADAWFSEEMELAQNPDAALDVKF